MTTSIHSRILVSFALVSLISAGALAADDSFVGKWKMNPDKSQLNGLTYKIEDAGGGQYKFSFGDDVETLTLDGKVTSRSTATPGRSKRPDRTGGNRLTSGTAK